MVDGKKEGVIIKLSYVFNLTKSGVNKIELPVGIKKCKIYLNTSVLTLAEVGRIGALSLSQCASVEFPIINGKSPNKFTVDTMGADSIQLRIQIEELGGIPDPDYFSDTPTVIPEIIPDEPTEQEVNNDAV